MPEAANLPFQSSFRDVCASINEYAGTQLITPGKLYICASLEDATDADNELLRNEIKVKTIIDTRRKQEQQSDAAWLTIGPTGRIVTSKFLGITRCRIKLVTYNYAKKIMAQLSVWTKCKIWFSMFTLNMDNPSVVEPVTDVVYARGPIGNSLDILDTARPQICELFDTLLSQDNAYPLLICGDKWMRDQNLLAVLILLLLDIPVEHISADHIASVQSLPTDQSQCNSKGEFAFVEAMVSNRELWVDAIKAHLDKLYGGAAEYISQGNVTSQTFSSLRSVLQAGFKAY